MVNVFVAFAGVVIGFVLSHIIWNYAGEDKMKFVAMMDERYAKRELVKELVERLDRMCKAKKRK